MAKKPIYRGARCTQDCGGTRAGFAYGSGGGRKASRYSPSFNRGMRMAIKAAKARVARKRRRKAK